MYNAQYSNNPFIDDPSNPSTRYPDIDTLERSSSGFTSPSPAYGGSSNFGGGYSGNSGSPVYGAQGYGLQPQQPQYQQQQSYRGWPQQSSPYGGGPAYSTGPLSPQSSGLPYQSGFSAQQYGQQQQQQQYGGYGQSYPNSQSGGYGNYVGQGQQAPPQYISEFDPLQVRTCLFEVQSISFNRNAFPRLLHPQASLPPILL